MTQVSTSPLDAAMRFKAPGWKLIPLYGLRAGGGCECSRGRECSSAGKHPRLNDWGNHASDNEERIAGWAEEWPTANVGLQLGPKSGVIDIEFDGEEGRATADRLLASVVTPSYKSDRSVHRLFKWRADLPIKSIRKVFGLECRLGNDPNGKAVQSVLPPSRHHSGCEYEWLEGLSPGKCEVAELPEELFAMLHNTEEADTAVRLPRRSGAILAPGGVSEGGNNVVAGRNDALLSFIGKHAGRIPAGRLDDAGERDEFIAMASSINATQCRPPLDDAEVKSIVDSALRAERSKRARAAIPAPTPETTPDDAEQRRRALLADARRRLGGGLGEAGCPEIVAVRRIGRDGADYEIVVIDPRTGRQAVAKAKITDPAKVLDAIAVETGVVLHMTRLTYRREVLPLFLAAEEIVETMTEAEAAEIWIQKALESRGMNRFLRARDPSDPEGPLDDDYIRERLARDRNLAGWIDPEGRVCLFAEGLKGVVADRDGDKISAKMAAQALRAAGFVKRRQKLWLPETSKNVWVRESVTSR